MALMINRTHQSSVFHFNATGTINIPADLKTSTAYGTDGYIVSGSTITSPTLKFVNAQPGDYITVASSTLAGNDGNYKIINVTADGGVITTQTAFTTDGADATATVTLVKDFEVTGSSITQIWWGSQSGSNDSYWQVERNSVNAAILTETGHIDYAGDGAALIQDNTSDIVCTLQGTTPTGFIMLEVQKLI